MIDPGRNAVIAIIGGVVLFAVFFAPIVIIQFRRFGRVSLARLLGAAAVAVYGVAIVVYTLFPLPGNTSRECAPHVQLIPFHFLADVARETAGESPLQVLSSGAVLQYVFNIALFVPWGIIVRRFFYRGVVVATLTGLALSLLVESTQYTGIWGIYGCSFRLADVDDLISNTAGALLGALIAPLVLWWMPSETDLRPRRLEPRPVTVRRRWFGMLIDWGLMTLGGATIGVVAVGVPQILGAQVPDWVTALVTLLVPGLLIFVLPALRGFGGTLGQRAVWLRPSWGDGALTIRRRLGRVWVPLVWTALLTVGSLAPASPLEVGTSVAVLLAGVEVVVVAATRGRGLGSMITGTTFVDSRAQQSDAGA